MLALGSPALHAAEPLSDEDRTELFALQKATCADFAKGEQSNLPKYVEGESLRLYMEEHRSFLKMLVKYLGEAEVSKQFEFTPDLQTILDEKDPTKYFGGLKIAGVAKDLAKKVNVINNVVAAAGDKSRAYIVVEGFVDGEFGKSDPHYSVWPAVHTADGWRLDIRSNLLKDLRVSIRDFEKRATGASK